jgi:hypothetical protein
VRDPKPAEYSGNALNRTKHDGQKKQDIFNQIRAALEVHATIEEEVFYPTIKKSQVGKR